MSTHTVVAGNTLYLIAKAQNITLEALIAANPQLNGSTNLSIGSTLNIPRKAAAGTGPTGGSDQEKALAIHNQGKQSRSVQRIASDG